MRYDKEAKALLDGIRVIKLGTKDGKKENMDLEISNAFKLL